MSLLCFLRPVQCTGLELKRDFLGNENMETNFIDCLAKEMAVLQGGWGPNDILADEDAIELGAIRVLRRASRSVADLIYSRLNSMGSPPLDRAEKSGGAGK